jgi:hypothetical protein
MNVYSDFTIPDFRRHVTIFSGNPTRIIGISKVVIVSLVDLAYDYSKNILNKSNKQKNI